MELEVNRVGTTVLEAKPGSVLLALPPQLILALLHFHPSPTSVLFDAAL